MYSWSQQKKKQREEKIEMKWNRKSKQEYERRTRDKKGKDEPKDKNCEGDKKEE